MIFRLFSIVLLPFLTVPTLIDGAIGTKLVANCPAPCECEQQLSSWVVYCHKSHVNDTIFADILGRLPLSLKSLHIEPPSNLGPNKFRWNDNINRFAQLKSLRLINSQIPAMSRSIRLPLLEFLDLSSNRIEHATMSNFGGMPALRQLDLSNNRLNILPTGVFTHVRLLRRLSLSNNSIIDLSTNLLRGLSSLKVLRLDHNPIPLAQINALFDDVPQLDELHLNYCNLTTISNISFDRIENLRHLGIAGNNLRLIPTRQLQNLPKLSSLNVGFNSIQEIFACAFCANNLSRLDLSGNLLGLPNRPFNSDAFRNIPLTHLDLSFNHLNNFDSTWLGWAQESITFLSLSGNFMKTFDEAYTLTLKSLEHFEMAFNSIDRIPSILPARYYYLKSLNISGNELSDFPDNINLLLPNLKELDISKNRFVSFSFSDLSFLNVIDRVFLNGNPWDCSCSVQSLQVHMRDRHAMRHSLHYDDVRCDTPQLVRGHSVLAITDVNDCAVLFGARYGLTQTSEMLILLAALLLIAALLLLLLGCIYFCRERQYKGSYVTREHSRTPLTMQANKAMTTTSSSVCSSSTNDDPLSPNINQQQFDPFFVSTMTTETFKSTPPLIPPAPPKQSSAYFGI